MRIRARHIVILVIVAITLFLFYAISLRETGTTPDYAVGLAPPVNVPIENAPNIELETTALDLGVIANDKIAEAAISVYNRGGSLLDVRDVQSSCPMCTIAYFEPGEQRIAPGQSAQLKIKVNPEGIFGFHSQKTVVLWCNDPRNPQVSLTVEAYVNPEFETEPEHFDFGDIAKGTAAQQQILFRNRTDTPILLREVSLHSEMEKQEDAASITFTVAPIPESDWQQPGRAEYRITATLSPDMRGGEFELSVFLHTNLKRFSPHRILARGNVIAPYTVTLDQDTPELHLHENTSGQITVRGESPIAISDVRSEKGFLELQQYRELPETHHIRCAPAESLERGIHKDSVLFSIELDGVAYSERIPVTVYVYGASPGANR